MFQHSISHPPDSPGHVLQAQVGPGRVPRRRQWEGSVAPSRVSGQHPPGGALPLLDARPALCQISSSRPAHPQCTTCNQRHGPAMMVDGCSCKRTVLCQPLHQRSKPASHPASPRLLQWLPRSLRHTLLHSHCRHRPFTSPVSA
jgi:hypothetical protein